MSYCYDHYTYHSFSSSDIFISMVQITVHFFYCCPEHNSCHRTSQHMQASYAIKLLCSVLTIKENPCTAKSRKISPLSLRIFIITYSWSIMCHMLHTLSFNVWWYVSGLHDIWSPKLQQITGIHEMNLYSTLPAQKNITIMKTNYLPF